MTSFQYLIIGGGMTAHAAATSLRETDARGTIGVIGEERDPFYARPPLSKGLWTGKPRESVWLPPVARVELVTGRRVTALDPARREVRDALGEIYRYERLLLATGGRPRRLPFGEDSVIYYRTLADHDRLAAAPGREVVVIGAGFIGSEIAAALTQAGRSVTMVFPEEAIGARAYPPQLARFVTQYFTARGVRVLAGETITGIERRGARLAVRTSHAEIFADVVVAGLGIEPSVELARDAGLAVSNGIDVDEELRTSAPGVWAAGDVACFPSATLGMRTRVEHEDNALTMGRVAGASMAGASARYEHLPFFYSDLFDLGYEAVGRLDARLEVVERWSTLGREGVCYYLEGDRVRGVLLWGMFGHVDAARELLRRHGPVARAELPQSLSP